MIEISSQYSRTVSGSNYLSARYRISPLLAGYLNGTGYYPASKRSSSVG